MTQKIKVITQPTKPFKPNTARDHWWAAVQKLDGKTVEALEKAVAKKPPHKNAKGKVEAVGGWVAFFKREGLIQLEADTK